MYCRKVIFTQDAFTRMFARSITPELAARAVESGEIIAEYPDDQPFPSYLVLYIEQGKALHVVVGKDGQDETCYLITAYWPDIELWSDDFRTRRKKMKCVICKQGNTRPGVTVVTLQRDDRTLVIKGVPAEICENCGEYYLSDEIAKKVYRQAEESLKHGAEVEIGRFVLSKTTP